MKHSTTSLSNGFTIPQYGFGTFQLTNDVAESAVTTALEAGYRLIDTASMYQNETEVGNAIRSSGLSRDDIIITTKAWNDEQGFENTLQAFERSKKRLGLDWIDIYLIHWARPDTFVDTWRALEKLYEEGAVKAIGVCNFYERDMKKLLDHSSVAPMLNQIEIHPWLTVESIREFCRKHSIAVESWGPLARAKRLDEQLLQDIAKKYDKTSAQVILRWHLQSDLIAIPRSSNPGRIKENYDIFDFELDDSEMKAIDNLDAGMRTGPHPEHFFD